jgi:excisionase family DNA binding protein
MLALLDQIQEPVTAAEKAIARQAAERLETVVQAKQDITVHIDSPVAANISVPLPAKVVAMMFDILKAMEEGTPVSVIPHEAELTTKQAADFLNVSRPYVCTLIDDGKLDARMVGRHRRIRFADLLAFEKAQRKQRDDALDAMHRRAERYGLNDMD